MEQTSTDTFKLTTKVIMLKLFIIILLTACSPMSYDHGVPNLSQVDSNVWRSGQINTQDGWQYVQYLVRPASLRVIKLNFDNEATVNGQNGDEIAAKMGIPVYSLPIQPAGDQGMWQDIKNVFATPDFYTVNSIEDLLSESDPSTVWLVHCTHGQDRTGLIIGMYRVLQDGWTKDMAYQEMLAHHFHPELIGLHDYWETW